MSNSRNKQRGVRNRPALAPPKGNRPASYTEHAPRALIEIAPTPSLERTNIIPGVNSYLRAYLMGECSIIVTKEYGHWHMSIARPNRLPSWDEVSEARYRLIPDAVTMAMILPPKADYINLHSFCLQMIEIDHARL